MPVSFKCGCGKPLKVKDEFAGRKVKCPSCGSIAVAPEITAQDLMSGSGSPEELPSGVKCLTCGAELQEEDPVCLKCGTIRQVAMEKDKRTRAKSQAPAEKPFYLKPLTWVAVVAILVCAVFIYNKYSGQAEEESGNGNNDEEETSEPETSGNNTKTPAPKSKTPEQLFTAELESKGAGNPDNIVEHILKLRDKAVPVLGTGIAHKERAVKLRSSHGLYVLAYFKCYRPQIQNAFRNISGRVGKDEELSRIALETLYFMATDAPEPAFLEFADIAGKYSEQFKGLEKSPPAGLAKDIIIKQFTQNQSNLTKAKAFTYLVLLGDKWNVKQIINLAKDAAGETAVFTKTALLELTGCAFEKQEDWNKWYSDNKNFPRARWLINSLESAPEAQRQKTIKKLTGITGKDFSYPENAAEEQKKEVIGKWKEFGKTLK
ncbi:MAG: hypothetical protein AB1599_05735 [Planctomycetota bacterium]